MPASASLSSMSAVSRWSRGVTPLTKRQTREEGAFAPGGQGLVQLKSIDPAKPFLFEVRDRVCAIRAGAFFDPDDPGDRVRRHMVRLDAGARRQKAGQELLAVLPARDGPRQPHRRGVTTLGRRVDRFLQHEHITRRPIRVAKPFLTQLSKVRIRATPGPPTRRALRALRRSRTRGDLARDRHAGMVRVRYRRRAAAPSRRVTPRPCASAAGTSPPWRSTGLSGGHVPRVHDRTGATARDRCDPYRLRRNSSGVFPELTSPVARSMKEQCGRVARRQPSGSPSARCAANTTSSCASPPVRVAGIPATRTRSGEGLGPGHARRPLATGCANTPKEKWPHFLFFGGDQIYADEIGDDHGEMLSGGASPLGIPGPVDPAAVRDKLIDGAWAGRFAHRYQGLQGSRHEVRRTRQRRPQGAR